MSRAPMYPTVKKAALLIILLIVLGVLGWAAHWFLTKRGTAVRLTSRSEQPVPRRVLENTVIYRQRDPLWLNERTGGSGETLGAVGCTVCCLSMAMAQHGLAL